MRTKATDEEIRRFEEYQKSRKELKGQVPAFKYESPTEGVETPGWKVAKPLLKGAILGALVPARMAQMAYQSVAHTLPEFMDEMKEGKYDPVKAMDVASWAMGGAGGALGAGTAKTGAGLRALASERFYSPLERALETGQVGKLTIGENPKASGVLSTLKFATDKNLISPEEIAYTGIGEKLAALGSQRVSREELLSQVKSKSLKATGEPTVLATPSGRSWMDTLGTLQGKANAIEAAHYRAVQSGANRDTIVRLMRQRDALETAIKRHREKGDLSPAYGPESHPTINLPGHIPGTYQERLFAFKPEGGLRYVEPHEWPGTVAENKFMFTRGHDRYINVGGERKLVKHGDEFQSQLHQTAAKEGYASPTVQFDAAKRDRLQAYWDTHVDNGTTATPRAQQVLEALQYENNKQWSGSNIPKAPFVKDWPKLALKEWVDTAIREGKDGVTWSTGRIVADRYNKLASEFNWTKVGDTYTLNFETPAGRTFTKQFEGMDELRKGTTANVAKIVQEQERSARPRRIEGDYHITEYSDGSGFAIRNEQNVIVATQRTRAGAEEALRRQNIADWVGSDIIDGPGAKGDFLVGGEFFEKVYDKDFVKYAEKEYGVTPKKVRVPTKPEHKNMRIESLDSVFGAEQRPIYNIVAETADGFTVVLREGYSTNAEAAQALTKLKSELASPGVEIWHLPFTETLKTRILSEGQRIAQGAPGVGSALRSLSEKEESESKPKVRTNRAFERDNKQHIDKIHERAKEIMENPEYHEQLKELERQRQQKLKRRRKK